MSKINVNAKLPEKDIPRKVSPYSVEQLARYLCSANGDNPDRTIQQFDQPRFKPVQSPRLCFEAYRDMAEAMHDLIADMKK